MLIRCYFNSIKVRLERYAELKSARDYYEFQFHKGTIRTDKLYRLSIAAGEFQFHKGTIRTFC